MKKLISTISVLFIILLFSTTTFADSVKEFLLTKSNYPVYVNGEKYTNNDLPILNYEGTTYVPLKEVGNMLNISVKWNERSNQVEIGKSSTKTSTAIEIFDVDSLYGHEAIAKYKGKTYLKMIYAAYKYDLDLVGYDINTKVVDFGTVEMDVQHLINVGDAVEYQGSVFIDEDVFNELYEY